MGLKKFVNNSLLVLVSNLLVKFFSFLSISFLAKNLSVTSFGFYNVILAYGVSVSQLNDLGSGIVIQQVLAGQDESKLTKEKFIGSTLLFLFAINCLLNLFFYFNFEFVQRHFFNNGSVSINYLILSLLVFLQFFSELPVRIISGLNDFKSYSYRSAFSSFVSLILIYIGSYLYGVNGAIYGYLISLLISLAVGWGIIISIFKEINFKLRITSFFYSIKLLLRKGFIYYLGNNLSGAILGFYVLNQFSNILSFDSYSFIRIGISISSILLIIPNAIQPVSITFLSDKSFEKSQIIVKTIQIKIIVMIIIAFVTVFIFFGNYFIQLFFGEKYINGANLILPILILNVYIISSSFISNFLISYGKRNFIGIVSVLGILLTFITYKIAIPKYGVMGFILGYSSGYLFGFVVNLIYESILVNKKYNDKSGSILIIHFLIVTLFLLIPYYLRISFNNSNFDTNFYNCIFCLIIFFSFIFFDWFFGFTKYEKQYLKNIFYLKILKKNVE
jgi:O-antigen/teichoic acid export membrane protein